jgi:hypothetical protein
MVLFFPVSNSVSDSLSGPGAQRPVAALVHAVAVQVLADAVQGG